MCRVVFLFCLSVALVSPAVAADFFSFETGVDGWTVEDGIGPISHNQAIESKTVAEGVPAAAITDGTHALELSHTGSGIWTQRMRAVSSLIHEDLLANTTMEFDLYIPSSTVPPPVEIMFDPVNNPNNKFYQFEISIEGGLGASLDMNFTKKIVQDGFDFLPGAEQDLPSDTSIHIVYEYAAKPQWLPNAVWSQITINTQIGDQFGDLDDSSLTASPWYIDNFQLTGGGTPGDFDGDADVDGSDFLEWQRDSTGRDLDDWQTNYGTVAGSLASLGVVPEPSSLVLIASAASLAWARRRR